MPRGPRSFSQRLTFRLGVSLCLGAAVIMIGAGVANLRVQRSHLTRVLQLTGEQTTQVIRGATRDAMMRNHPEDVLTIIQTIAAQQDVALIRVFDKQGRIRKSSRPGEIGTLVDTDAEQCFACHARDEPIARLQQEDRTRVFTNPDGSRMLGVIAPIENEPKCSNASCHAHPASQRVLGVLDVHLPLGPVDEAIAVTERQTIMGVTATALAVLVMASILVWHMVLKPVKRLTGAASMAAAGDLPPSVPVTSSDELGRLSTAWNDMVAELERARRQLERWGKDLEKKIQQKTAELETAHQQMLLVEKMAALGKLAAVMAHEINNPLTGITTYSRLLRKRLAPAEEHAGEGAESDTGRALRLIEEESRRCGNIVRNLLLFSRRRGARFSEEHLPSILERCVMLVRHQAELSSVSLELRTPDELPPITCDASQIQQMVLVLAMNAMEATPAGGSVTLSALAEGATDQAVIQVTDTGRGIPRENLDKIFEPFFTTKEGGYGVGLGLSVVYGIVKRHNGTIDVKSVVGEGSTFTVRLPLHQESASAPTAESSRMVTS